MILFGGSFDPFHKDHERIISHLLKEYDEDITILVQQNPFKDKGMIPLEHRVKSIKHLYKGNKRIDVKTTSQVYLADWLKNHREIKSLVMGSDSFQDIDNWKNPKYIRSKKIIIIDREEFGICPLL